MLLFTSQELTESGDPSAVMDVLTYLQRPVERIQTYQALLKVSITVRFLPACRHVSLSCNSYIEM